MYPSLALLKLLLGSPTLLSTSKASDSTFFMKHFLFPQLAKTSLLSNSCYCFNCSALLRVWRNLLQGHIHEATWKDLLFVRHCNGYWGSRNDLTASLFYIKKALFWAYPCGESCDCSYAWIWGRGITNSMSAWTKEWLQGQMKVKDTKCAGEYSVVAVGFPICEALHCVPQHHIFL